MKINDVYAIRVERGYSVEILYVWIESFSETYIYVNGGNPNNFTENSFYKEIFSLRKWEVLEKVKIGFIEKEIRTYTSWKRGIQNISYKVFKKTENKPSDIGNIAYEKYKEIFTKSGVCLPEWINLSPEIKNAWNEAANEIIKKYEK